jgi:hypothetical protein
MSGLAIFLCCMTGVPSWTVFMTGMPGWTFFMGQAWRALPIFEGLCVALQSLYDWAACCLYVSLYGTGVAGLTVFLGLSKVAGSVFAQQNRTNL